MGSEWKLESLCLLAVVVFMLPTTIKVTNASDGSSFSFQLLGRDRKSLSKLSFQGDASMAIDGYGVQLTKSFRESVGSLMYRNPIKFSDAQWKSNTLFSNNFSFSLASDKGGGFAFVMVLAKEGQLKDNTSRGNNGPVGKRVDGGLAIQFDFGKYNKSADFKPKYVGSHPIGRIGYVKYINLSSPNFGLSRTYRLHAWIDFHGSSNMLAIRVSENISRPADPQGAYYVNLAKFFNGYEVLVGFRSAHGKGSHSCLIHSWSFTVGEVPTHMHSIPLDPFGCEKNATEANDVQIGDRGWGVVAVFLCGVAAGACVVTICVYLWIFKVFPIRGGD